MSIGSRARTVLDVLSTLIVTGAAIAMVTVFLTERGQGGQVAREARFIETWREDSEGGIRIGPRDAPIVITEFMDFQCPFCRQLVPLVDSILTAYPTEVAVAFQHFPLRIHDHAVAAAIAAECAERQGRFTEMYRSIFASQEHIGSRPWREYANESRVPDLEAFDTCISLPADSFPRIQNGRDLGSRTGVRGTPTVWINGSVGPLSFRKVRDLVEKEALSGRARKP